MDCGRDKPFGEIFGRIGHLNAVFNGPALTHSRQEEETDNLCVKSRVKRNE